VVSLILRRNGVCNLQCWALSNSRYHEPCCNVYCAKESHFRPRPSPCCNRKEVIISSIVPREN